MIENENTAQEQETEQTTEAVAEQPVDTQTEEKNEGMPTGIQERVPDEEDLDNMKFERPETFPSKFWDENDGPDVEGLAKSYNELEKRFHNGDHKAPENYDLNFVTEKGVPEDDALLTQAIQWSKDNNIPQSQFEKIVNTYIESNEQKMQDEEDFIKNEKTKLGNNADAIIESTIKWGKSLVGKGVLTNDDYTELENWGSTAEGIRLLGKFRQMMGEREIPTASVEGQQLDKDELQQLVADSRYGVDIKYTKDVERKFQQAYPD